MAGNNREPWLNSFSNQLKLVNKQFAERDNEEKAGSNHANSAPLIRTKEPDRVAEMFEAESKPPTLSPDEHQALNMISAAIEARKSGAPAAYANFQRGSGFEAQSTGDTMIIDDVDCYISEGEIFVSDEGKMVPVSEYLRSRGIPSSQKIRLEGCLPDWAKAALAKRRNEKR